MGGEKAADPGVAGARRILDVEGIGGDERLSVPPAWIATPSRRASRCGCARAAPAAAKASATKARFALAVDDDVGARRERGGEIGRRRRAGPP